MKLSVRCFVLAVFCVGMAGCEGEVLDTVDAGGLVKLDGKPAEGVMLTLVPSEGVKGRGGYGLTEGDGSVGFRVDPETPGVPPGSYLVLAQKLTMPDGSPIPPDTSGAEAEFTNKLSPIYSDPGRSPLQVTVPPTGAKDIAVELVSRPQPRSR